MAEDDEARWARGLDEPMPLPEGVRSRLEDALLGEAGASSPSAPPPGAEEPRPLPPGLAEDLGATLADPVATAMAGIDGARPLPAELRRRLERRLDRRRRPPVWLAGAAAAVLAAAAIGAAVHGSGPANVASGTSRASQGAAGSAVGAAPGGNLSAGGSGGGVAGGSNSAAGIAGPGAASQAPLAPAAPDAAAGGPTGGGAGGGGGLAAEPAGAVVYGLSPAAGPLAGGTSVTITGRGLSRTTGVSFGSVPARSFSVRSDGSVTAVSPAAQRPGAVAVSVLTSNGPAPVAQGGSNAFDYAAPPSVTGVSPPVGPAGGGNWVTVTGSGFAPGDTVSFGGTPAGQVQVVSAGQLRALAPAHGPGPVDVVVTGPGGPSPTGPADRYSFA